MSEIGQINNFGNLTVNGRKLTFEDFDKNNDGTISIQEYNSLLKEVKLDSIDFTNIDNNSDESISKEEFSIWEQKTLMQEAVKDLAPKISTDFSGKPQYLEEITNALKNLINDYAKTYYGDIKLMAENFKKELPNKYEQIKEGILANDPSTISAEVIFEFSQNLASEYSSTNVPNSFLPRIITELNKEATRFLQNYSDDNLRYDLQEHLKEFLNTSEAQTMAPAVELFHNNINSINTEDIDAIKEQVKQLLQACIKNGINVKIGSLNILTDAAIISSLKMFNNVNDLLNVVNNIISSFNTETRLNSMFAEEQLKKVQAEHQAFLSVSGSEYQIDTTIIDYTKLDQRYFNGGKIYYKSRKHAKKDAFNEGYALLTDDALKSQVKTQIETMLQAKGIPFEKVANIFENVYNQTAQETLNQKDMITGKHKTWFRRAEGKIDVKTMYDTFLAKFNVNIVKAIEAMNSSAKDFDTIDLDYNALDGNGVAINGEDFSSLYASGQTVTIEKKGADYYVKIADKLIDNMKEQILKKAQNMCIANGVEFDDNAFEAIFNNAKLKGIVASVTGQGKNERTVNNSLAGAASGVGVATCSAFAGGAIAGAGTFFGAMGMGVLTACGPVGWALAAVGLVLGIVLGPKIFGKSSSTLNTKTLIDTFTKDFVENYTKWINETSLITLETVTNTKSDTEAETTSETAGETNTDTTSEDNPNKKDFEEA